MRYQVPQFIEVEDKLVGPMTLKQFIYLVGGAGLSFIVYVFIGNLFIAIIPIFAIMAIAGALGFYRLYNYFPLINVVEAAYKYWRGNKLYIWQKNDKPKPKTPTEAVKDIKNYATLTVPKISDSKLKDLSWSLDIKESIYSNKKQK